MNSSQMQFYTPSSTNLFVRYLPREVDDNHLREIFSAFGTITSSMVMRDIHNGQSLGTAFVRYAHHEEALRALRDAHGMPLFGKTVSVQWAKQQHDDTPSGQDRLKMNKLFLRNVPLDVSEAQLVERLCVYGSVVSVTLHNDTTPVTDPALRRRIAFITFSEAGAAEAALRGVHNTCAFHQCHGIPLMGKLSEDYSQKTRTPRTPRTPHAVMTPHSSRRGVPLSPQSSTVSNALTPRSDYPTTPGLPQRVSGMDGVGYLAGGTPRTVETPQSAAGGRTSHNPGTFGAGEAWGVPLAQQLETPDIDFDVPLVRTREPRAPPTMIHAPDTGITVTVRQRTTPRTPLGYP